MNAVQMAISERRCGGNCRYRYYINPMGDIMMQPAIIRTTHATCSECDHRSISEYGHRRCVECARRGSFEFWYHHRDCVGFDSEGYVITNPLPQTSLHMSTLDMTDIPHVSEEDMTTVMSMMEDGLLFDTAFINLPVAVQHRRPPGGEP